MSARLEVKLAPDDAARLDVVADHARHDHWAERLMDRDTSLLSDELAVRDAIADRLGWLDAPEHFTRHIPDLEGFGDGIRVAGFTTAVVMGMGGSSLAPEVLHRVFGTTEGYLDLRILDSTDPAAVAAVVDDLDPLQTLWIVASKSGTTTEPLAFMADAWARVEAALDAAGTDQSPGDFFVAITDPGRSVEAIPHQDELRERFLNPPDVGGRYSALTYVGLVPASLIGLDLDALLTAGSAMLALCREPEPIANPGLHLGLAIGSLALAGRDKLTFIAEPDIASFGSWAEQLLAESTGKQGRGIVPIDREPVGSAKAYGPDRAFVSLSLAASDFAASPDGRAQATLLDELHRLGHPVIRIELDDPIDLAGEVVRWEVATAFAGVVLGIDPFDQPNVEEAKERTRRLLAGASRRSAASASEREEEPLHPQPLGEEGLAAALKRSLGGRRPPAYLGIQAFIAATPERDTAIAGIRAGLGATGCATTAGYGPRFLHSTGQLHKGGPPMGWFLQLTADHPRDRQIPGWPYSFGRLIDAQARGDREAIRAHDRPVVHVHLGPDVDADLAILERAVARATS
ncbi:MAG TPA: glucose-6-phosphate isomerase [Candidatus Eisenbacteria bacterium]|nr:glucose-6-phosphate isomerase [Candidatus Eisenbacteria bacterium]